MSTMIEAPISAVEAVADLYLPPRADQRMQDLMDGNNDGALTPEQRECLEAVVELRSPKYLRKPGTLQSSWGGPINSSVVCCGPANICYTEDSAL